MQQATRDLGTLQAELASNRWFQIKKPRGLPPSNMRYTMGPGLGS